MKKRIVSSILSVAMILSIMPTNVFATQSYSVNNVFSEYENNADTDIYNDLEETDEETLLENQVEEDELLENQVEEELSVSTVSVVPITSDVAQNTDTSVNYTSLQDAVDNSSSIKLLADVEISSALLIEKEITIDLNGYDIKQTSNTMVIEITNSSNSKLLLKDTNTQNRIRYGYWDEDEYKMESVLPTDVSNYTQLEGGAITGGVNTNGGGLCIYNNATFEMEGGNITGNKASLGGGIYINGDSTCKNTLKIRGGKISNNIATYNGGGIYAYATGTFELNEGVISENTASLGGGVYSHSWFYMNGGTILNNTATNGGGVYVLQYNKLVLTDGEITGNIAGTGNCVYLNGGSFELASGKIQGYLCMDDEYSYNMVTFGSIARDVVIDGTSIGYLSAGTNVYFNGTTWTTEKVYEARIGSTMYKTLEEAVSSAYNNTITLLADVELEEALSISKEITIDLNGYDIK